MSLTVASIQTAKDDEELFQRLSDALKEVFPPELQEDRDQFLAALLRAPRGLRAMAGIFDLDVSMSISPGTSETTMTNVFLKRLC